MIVPDSCMPWIELQRHDPKYVDYRKNYIKDIEKEYNLMSPYLPDKCDSILDIGCGVAGIDVLLSKHYDNPDIYLLDANHKSSNMIYGFGNKESYYNSLLATRDMMLSNGISKYHILNLNSGLECINNIDIIISTLSCGYHYPVKAYLETISRILSKNGILIIDIRENTNGIEEIKKILTFVQTISNYNKSFRICARRFRV